MNVAYSNGYLLKHSHLDMEINLKDGVTSRYDVFHSYKVEANGSKYEKSYKLLAHNLIVEDARQIGEGYSKYGKELYLHLFAHEALQKVANKYSLPMPILGDNFTDFKNNFNDWAMTNTTYENIRFPIICSIKFNDNNEPVMLKIYRGNYEPTDTEIQEAKDYWSNVPS